jgi:hypothetical protein
VSACVHWVGMASEDLVEVAAPARVFILSLQIVILAF